MYCMTKYFHHNNIKITDLFIFHLYINILTVYSSLIYLSLTQMNIELVKMRSIKIQFLIIIHDLCLAIWINEEEFMKAAFWTKLNNRRRTFFKTCRK